MSIITPFRELPRRPVRRKCDTGSPSRQDFEPKSTSERERDGYEARVVDVWQYHYGNPLDGGRFLLDVPEMNQRFAYHAKSCDSDDAGTSLKLISYFLMHEISAKHRSKHLRVMIGRYVIVKVRHVVRNGRVIPVIAGFNFSEQQFFSHRSPINN